MTVFFVNIFAVGSAFCLKITAVQHSIMVVRCFSCTAVVILTDRMCHGHAKIHKSVIGAAGFPQLVPLL